MSSFAQLLPCGQGFQDVSVPAGQWRNVLYHDGRFYAVDLQSVVASLDGRYWERVWTPSDELKSPQCICWGNGQYVVGGQFGLIATSSDGLHWTERDIPRGLFIRSVTASPDGFLAAANGYELLYSEDGIEWSQQSYAVYPDHIDLLVWGKGLYLGMSNSGGIYTSKNGKKWKQVEGLTVEDGWQGVTFDGNRFIAVAFWGSIGTSPDGTNWRIMRVADHYLFAVASSGSTIVAAGDAGVIYRSFDGVTWENRSLGRPCLSFGAAYGGGQFVVVGQEVLTSFDGRDWDTALYSLSWGALAYGNGLFVAKSHSAIISLPDAPQRDHTSSSNVPLQGLTHIATSRDGLAWNYEVRFDKAYTVPKICFGAGRFVAIASEDHGTTAVITTSEDGETWTRRDDGTFPILLRVVYAHGQFLAAGKEGAMYSSSDGIVWTRHQLPTTENLGTVAFGPLGFVVPCDDGSVYFSRDAYSWEPTCLEPHSYSPGTAAYGNGVYLVWMAGAQSGLWSSRDGVTWTPHTCSCGADDVTTVFFDGSRFIATVPKAIFASKEGVEWERLYETPLNWPRIAFGDGTYVLAGSSWIQNNACTLHSAISAGPRRSEAPTDVGFLGIARGGVPPYTYTWDFGDGTQGEGERPGHSYSQPGEYVVSLVVRDALSSSYTAFPVEIAVLVRKPSISSVSFSSNPPKLSVGGSDFHQGCVVQIGDTQIATKWKSSSRLKGTGGSTLKALLPKGTPVLVTVLNPDETGQSEPFTFIP